MLQYKFILLSCAAVISQAVPYQQGKEAQAYNSIQSSAALDHAVGTYQSTEEPSEKDTQYSASQILENPSYDPSLYNYLPADSVQQYVNHYGGPYQAAQYAPGFPNPGAFAVQTGYEGYLVPEVPQTNEMEDDSNPLSFLRGVLPRTMFGLLVRVGAYLLSGIGVLLFGGALTTAVCTLTPLCTISFAALPFLGLRNTAETLSKTLGAEITPDRVRRTAELVKDAIEKYSQMQIDEETSTKDNVQKIKKE